VKLKREKKIPHPLERWAPDPPDIAADRVAAPEKVWAGGAIDIAGADLAYAVARYEGDTRSYPEWMAELVLAYTSPDVRAALVADFEEETA
jgi:hypothetical protein